jgi:hypothetical protein
MTGRRLPLLVLLVVGLVAIVALVAHGRPLAASAGRGGVPVSFWSYVLTTVAILFALGVILIVASLLSVRTTFTKPKGSLVALFLRNFLWLTIPLIVLAYLFHRLHHGAVHVEIPGGGGGSTRRPPTGSSGAHFVWLEALVVFGLLAVSIAAAAAIKRRKRESPRDSAVAPEAVAEALDDSLDDLRTDPDVRRAIVAAYARMENALRVTGLPRRPAEAPLEYLERALHTLDTSGPSVRRLTDLFQWAKFSHHEPEPTMRDEAIDALMAVRDELREPVEVPA